MLRYGSRVMGSKSGVSSGSRGAACLAAQVRLMEQGWIGPEEKVVLFNTGSGLGTLICGHEKE